ncbi:MAG TPA: hypothetical protein VGN88_10065, partial [Phycisphaerae bacterium]
MKMRNYASVMALCVGASIFALTSITSVGNGQAPRGGAPAAAGANAVIVTSMLDSSKSNELPTVFPLENMGAKFEAPKLPSMDEATPIAPFPDPFAWVNDPLGKTRSTAFADWEKHRTEMMAMIEKYEIGPKPAVDIATQVTATFTPNTPPAPAGAPGAGAWNDNGNADVFGFGGGAGGAGAAGGRGGRGGRGGGGPGGTLVVKVTVNGKSLTLTCPVSIPAGAKAPYP